MDKLQSMRSFVQVVDDGSFVRAADRLGISQSAINRQVTLLEQQLGERLLIRKTRELSVTDFGRSYCARIRDILKKLDALERAVLAPTRRPAGTLRIAVLASLSLEHLASCLYDYCKTYSDVLPMPVLVDRPTDLVREGYDVGIIDRSSVSCTSLVVRTIYNTPRIACASPAYLTRHGEPTRPEQLTDHVCVTMSAARVSGTRHTHSEMLVTGPDGSTMLKCRPALVVNNVDFLVQMILSGTGIGFVEPALVRSAIQKGTLKPLLPGYSSPGPTICVAYPSRHHLPPKVRTFVDHLLATFETYAPA
ncbi:LysR family transcriptional regulator [Burkholderia humptydooensis]|uniref:LysR family transcriptional regulator n=2 Tax=Burkholderia humptydooensis TaxID=430531 RepID=A0A7T2WZL8_9BURK|nr:MULTISPECIES: LysR family transcriptional regulator [Burkholderia]AJY43410.1 bacterial regulatory helix-turn-helix, lysR family protein [Burkholderia sp. 2002721687]EIP84769.1 Transcriptional regulator, LysR family [Burkholderia humptydooensis MSMB43]QPS44953.1 LysR family transcriptional regulator [Burkholderia humptydooensis]